MITDFCDYRLKTTALCSESH